ncbi:MAG: MerC domain-containing protein [Flavobacteriales bacterium]|nr:MerC domain-containing protein [Flavobacteriales bacterium]
MRKILNIDLDVIGASASLLCAVHCALVPLILTFGMLGGISFLADPFWDIIFISSAAILALTSLVNGYRNHHKNIRPMVTAVLGFLGIILGHTLLHNLFGDVLSVLGGSLIAYAHFLNYKACRTCKLCRD